MASSAQTKKIHTLLNVIGVDDSTYRTLLATYGVSTSKALTTKEAGSLIGTLEKFTPNKSQYSKRFDNLGIREGMATPKQLRKIERMWFDVSRQGTRAEALKALRSFLTNRFNVSDMTFITKEIASKVVTALTAMKKQSIKASATVTQKPVEKAQQQNVSECKIYDFASYAKGDR